MLKATKPVMMGYLSNREVTHLGLHPGRGRAAISGGGDSLENRQWLAAAKGSRKNEGP